LPEELLQRVDKARESFAQLQSLQQNQAAMQARVKQLDSLYKVSGLVSSDALSSFGLRRNSDEQRALLSQTTLQVERHLRSLMGLAATDGRLITPVDE
jgi:hypothetical protein